MKRILLSVPHAGPAEQAYTERALLRCQEDAGSAEVEAFEAEFEALIDAPVLALNSGTAAIQIGLKLLGVRAGDEVFCQDLTFVATANPIRELGAEPVFIDADYETWNMDPDLLRRALRERAANNTLPKVVVAVDLFGQCADMDQICEACDEFNIPVLEDAAEALGGYYKGRPAGTLGTIGVFSFNGNKVITTTGGGILVCRNRGEVETARRIATLPSVLGIGDDCAEMSYDFPMSGILAALGRAQLESLRSRVARRRSIARRYRAAFADLPGVTAMPEAQYGFHTHWLSCFLVEDKKFGCSRDELIKRLDAAGIESRPVWKPMHLQPLFACSHQYGGMVAEDLFHRGICLPSSSSLGADEQMYVIEQVELAGRSTCHA
jgi:pyridoxal phosphate-dependent aminotransferase EpsN